MILLFFTLFTYAIEDSAFLSSRTQYQSVRLNGKNGMNSFCQTNTKFFIENAIPKDDTMFDHFESAFIQELKAIPSVIAEQYSSVISSEDQEKIQFYYKRIIFLFRSLFYFNEEPGWDSYFSNLHLKYSCEKNPVPVSPLTTISIFCTIHPDSLLYKLIENNLKLKPMKKLQPKIKEVPSGPNPATLKKKMIALNKKEKLLKEQLNLIIIKLDQVQQESTALISSTRGALETIAEYVAIIENIKMKLDKIADKHCQLILMINFNPESPYYAPNYFYSKLCML